MFQSIRQQAIADQFKARLQRISKPDERREAMDNLQQFEASPWYPQVLQQAVDEIAPNRFGVDAGLITFNGTNGESQQAMSAILARYLDLLVEGLPPTARSTGLDGLFTTDEATNYVSAEVKRAGKELSPRQVRRYIMAKEGKKLEGRKVGHSLIFSQQILDEFVQWYLAAEIKPGPKVGSHNKRTKKETF